MSLQSHFEADIDATREQLQHLPAVGNGFLGALSSLSREYDAFWQDDSDNGGAAEGARSDKGYFLFEEHAEAWAEMFVMATKTGRPLLTSAPDEVVENLKAGRPDRVPRGWIVIYYGVILTRLSTTGAADADMKAKLRSNLWLAMNDVRLLLEPSDLNVQALTVLACHVEEFTTPSLCWMLISSACRMLQALGVNQKHFDEETQRRRNSLFWTLNGLDKPLALMFGRTPTFHRATMEEVPLPTVEQLLAVGFYKTGHRALLTAAHFMNQWNCLTKTMGDVWSVLYENNAGGKTIAMVKDGLESWYHHAVDILEASALAEKPLLGEAAAEKIEGALDGFRFQYCYLAVMLTRHNPQWSDECMRLSRQMLRLLGKIVPDFDEPFNGIGVTWQLLYSPFAPFFVLYRKLLSSGRLEPAEAKKDLEAMENVATFLKAIQPRHHQAARLERIALVFTQHARSLLSPEHASSSQDTSAPRPAGKRTLLTQHHMQQQNQERHLFADTWEQSTLSGTNEAGPADQPSSALHTNGFPFAGMGPMEGDLGADPFSTEMDLDQLLAWIPQQDAFGETSFDWLAWDSQMA